MKTIAIFVLFFIFSLSTFAYECQEQVYNFNSVVAQLKQQKDYEQQVLYYTANNTEMTARWIEAQASLDAKKVKGIEIHNLAWQINDARLKMYSNNEEISKNLINSANEIYKCLNDLLYQARIQNPPIQQ